MLALAAILVAGIGIYLSVCIAYVCIFATNIFMTYLRDKQ